MNLLRLENRRVLVTGASGFVGRRVAELLSAKNCAVICSTRRLAVDMGVLNANRFESGDIDGSTNWRPALVGVDAIVHCAARVHVMSEKSATPADQFRKVNVDATLNLARQAAEFGVKRLIYLSSIKVNGEASGESRPFGPSDTPHPIGDYAVSKYEAEKELLQLSAKTGLEIVVIRPPLIYGPGVSANFEKLAKVVQMGIPLPLGKVNFNRRSMVFLDNLVDFILVCLAHPSAADQVFLVSDGEDVSTAELVKRMGKNYGKVPMLLPVPILILRIAANLMLKETFLQRLIGNLQVDQKKNFDLLNWSPRISLDEGLAMTLSSSQRECSPDGGSA